jgi:uncharacterized membrane-anchored protein YitT (DUF2179 family)
METWFVNVLSGSATYFAPIAIFAIICLAAYFRMTGLTMGFMLFVFLLMFSGFVPASLLIFVAIIGGLLVGIIVSRIVKN